MNVSSARALESYQRQQTQEAGSAATQIRSGQSQAARAERPAQDTVELSASARVASRAEEIPDTDQDRATEQPSNQARARSAERSENQNTQTEADKAALRSQKEQAQQATAAQDAATRLQATTVNLYA